MTLTAPVGRYRMSGRRPRLPAPAGGRRQAPMRARPGAPAVIVMLLAAGACASAEERRLAPLWKPVQAHFDRLERFELDFRQASAAEAGKSDPEKLAFVRKALHERAALQAALTREMQRVSRSLVPDPPSVRALYVSRLRGAVDSLKAVQDETMPFIEKLGLQKYASELARYRSEADRAAASSR